MLSIGMPTQGPYKASLNFQTLANLYNYLVWSLNGFQFYDALVDLTGYWIVTPYKIVGITVALGSLGYLVLKQGRTLLFAAFWFVTALLPVLPFTGHAQNYYVNIAVVAISILIAASLSSFKKYRLAAVCVFIPLYLVVSLINVRYQEKHLWVTRRAGLAQAALLDIKALHPKLPDHAVLYFSGTGEEEFWAYNFGDLFKVYYGNNDLGTLFEPKDALPRQSGTRDQLYLLTLRQGHLHDAAGQTQKGGVSLAQSGPAASGENGNLPAKIDFAGEVAQNELGKGWYQAEAGHRWMARNAEVFLSAPGKEHQGKNLLIIKGTALLDYFPRHEVEVTLKLNDRVVGAQKIQKNGPYRLESSFDGSLGSPLKLAIELSQSFVPAKVTSSADTRELGLSVSSIELQQR